MPSSNVEPQSVAGLNSNSLGWCKPHGLSSFQLSSEAPVGRRAAAHASTTQQRRSA
jgi:hypothetical protein